MNYSFIIWQFYNADVTANNQVPMTIIGVIDTEEEAIKFCNKHTNISQQLIYTYTKVRKI